VLRLELPILPDHWGSVGSSHYSAGARSGSSGIIVIARAKEPTSSVIKGASKEFRTARNQHRNYS
jgi:hypothetical protein